MPPVAVNIVEEPLQIATPEPAPMVGMALTVTVTITVLLQPLVVPVTVYIVVDDGLAVTLAPVVADKPVDGDHE